MKLLCTDLDRTLLPNGDVLESALARPVLWQLISTHDLSLAYVSGRSLSGVLQAIEQYRLSLPDIIVADVGTSVYVRNDREWIKNVRWETAMAGKWKGRDAEKVGQQLDSVEGLEHQEEYRQSSFKRSYYYPESVDERELRQAVVDSLETAGIQASLVFSFDPDKGVGLLDVLPDSGSKSFAVRYLQELLELDTQDILFAGDSGNDVSAIVAQNPGVLVANADARTRDAVKEASQNSENLQTTYFAQGDFSLAGEQMLNGNYAAGIVEGMVHFRPQWRESLNDASWIDQAIDQAIRQAQ